MKTKYNKSLLSLAVISGLAGIVPSHAIAQEAAAEDYEVIQVTGFRSSQIKAKDIKREAMIAQDSIVAEDIADFPDLNLADSLQRIPGVVITREGGEGRQISLRGLGPDFTRVQVNGMEALSTSSSPMDSRGAVGRSRAFDFNIFASELFNQIDVKKSYSADQDEGGIGGTVDLHTARPFDYDGLTSAISTQVGTNSNTDSTDPRFAGMISNTWGKFGALASIAYSKRETSEESYNTYRWRQKSVDASNISPNIDAETAQLLQDGEIWFSRGNRYSVWENQQERLGITASLQYNATDDLDFTLDYMHGKLSNELTEHHISSGGSSSTALGYVEELEWIDNNGDKEAVKGRFSDLRIRTENRADYNESTFDQVTLRSNWNITEDLKMVAQIGTSSSDYDQPKVDKVNLQNYGNEMTLDFTQDRFYGVNTYDFDTTSPDNWTVKDLYFREDYISTDFDNAKVDFEYFLTDESTLDFGANYKKFSNTGERREAANFPTNEDTPLNQGDFTLPAEAINIFTGHAKLDWIEADVDALQTHYGVYDLALTSADTVETSNFSIEETTTALYGMYSWAGDVAGSDLRANIGLRYYDTEITSAGFSQGVDVEIVRDYSGVLPTLNIAYEIGDELLLRFGASKNVTRPSLSEIAVSANVSQSTLEGEDIGAIAQGNPGLEPFESVNFDMSLEWYFDDVGLVSAAIFHKDIDNFIVTESETFQYKDLGLPNDLLPPGGTPETYFEVSQPQNSDSSTIKGAEIAFQRDLDFLPAPFDKLGMIANYTWVDGTTEYRNVQGSGENQVKSFPGLSNNSYNLTFYYETDTWGARIAAAYRSDYISVVEGGLGDEDERGFHATTYIDFSAFYQLTEALKVNVEGVNLTNQREEQYSDSSDRAYNTTTSGRTFMVGATYKF